MLRRLLLLSVLLVPVTAHAQPARLDLAYLPGVRYTFTQTDTMDAQVSFGAAGQEAPPARPMRMVTLSVADFTVAERGAELLMTRTERRRRIWSDGPGGVELVDTDSAASIAASPTGPIAMALVGRPVQLRMTRDGRVLELLGRDSLLAALLATVSGPPELHDMMEGAFGALLDGLAASSYTLPPAAAAVGSTWTQTMPGAGPVPFETAVEYTFEAHEGDVARLGFTGTIGTPADAPLMGEGPMAFRMHLGGTVAGTWHLNLHDGTSATATRTHLEGTGAPAEPVPGMPAFQVQLRQDGRSWIVITRAEG